MKRKRREEKKRRKRRKRRRRESEKRREERRVISMVQFCFNSYEEHLMAFRLALALQTVQQLLGCGYVCPSGGVAHF